MGNFHYLVCLYVYQGRRKLLKAGWVSITMGGGHNLPPLVEIGLTDLLKPGWAIARSAHPYPTPLCLVYGLAGPHIFDTMIANILCSVNILYNLLLCF